ncbi:patatin-like phospholipase family protein [Marichromatium gracile]|uniref:NTE family protein n=1 Tax=Marichromatium gracile TaxID=1048 RepID=A0A4R4A542_MARGR|nr:MULTISPECIES: patatin-like phospholipase family protein [Marichromatium]MBK1709772.1 phospholipase [Marichromatium gracile]MCF1182136.1 patatin-like phospholipase family protein [Marichromatium gracile]RNE92955.1 phospholipase [Marichromatium sp. AB32]TCW33295.1 NTE family protein [Marichromatium gracile]
MTESFASGARSSHQTHQARPPEINRLVPILAGGGTRLPAHVGVIQALGELDIDCEHIVGVSGGSIVAGLFAAGWSAEAMKELAINVDFRRFRDFNLYQLLFRGGLSSGDGFERWMDEMLEGARFRDLSRTLHVVATDVRNGSPVVFDRDHDPDMRVSQAIRYSMGIPLLFAYREYRQHLMIDGCILSEDALRRDWAGDGTPSCCFRLRANEQNERPAERRRVPLPGYLQMLIRAFMTTLSREFVQDVFWNTTVVIDTGEISPLEFRLSPETKLELYQAGYRTTLEILPVKLGKLVAQRGTGAPG